MGKDMECGWVRQHVERILDGEYPPAVGDQLAEHLRACRDCARLLHAAEEEERALQAASPWPDAPRDFTPEIMASLPPTRHRLRLLTHSPRFFRLALPVAAAAAAVVLAFALRFRTERDDGEVQPDVALHPGTGAALPGAVARPQAPLVATVRASSGTVQVLPERGGPQPMAAGMALRLGTVLKTAPGSAIELDFGGKARVRLDSDSTARVTPSAVALVSGRLFVWVAEQGTRFSVVTPQAEAEVRGTEFCVDSRTEGRTILTVVEGVVVFSNDHGTVEVEAGLQSHAETGSGPRTARPVDVSAIVAWVGSGGKESDRGIDVRLRARLDQRDGHWASGTPALVVELDYPDTDSACTPLRLSCEITDTEGRTVSEQSMQVSTPLYRYRVRKVNLAGLRPGRYRAGLRIVGRNEGSTKTLEFEVR